MGRLAFSLIVGLSLLVTGTSGDAEQPRRDLPPPERIERFAPVVAQGQCPALQRLYARGSGLSRQLAEVKLAPGRPLATLSGRARTLERAVARWQRRNRRLRIPVGGVASALRAHLVATRALAGGSRHARVAAYNQAVRRVNATRARLMTYC